MLESSVEYGNKVIARERRPYGRVELQVIDTTAVSDVTVIGNSTESDSVIEQIVNENRTQVFNYTTFEADRIILDGTFTPMSDSGTTTSEIGWWSIFKSESDNTFTTHPELTFTFTTNHTSIGFTIDFDLLQNEYATVFDIEFYDSGDNLIDTVVVTDNDSATYECETGIVDYRKIVLTIKEWSKPNRRARIIEFSFGLFLRFDKENQNLTKVSVTEELSPTSEVVTSDTTTFSIGNIDRLFDLINPTGLYIYLQQRQKVKVSFGFDVGSVIEYLPYGTFYLKEWSTDNKSLEATMKGQDAFTLMTGEYRKSVYSTTNTLKDIAVDILTELGFDADEYIIDDYLDTIIPKGFLPVMAYREALQTIAIAGECILKSDRYGRVVFQKVTSVNTGYEIDFSLAFEEPTIELRDVVYSIEGILNTYTLEAGTSEVYKATVGINGTVDLVAKYEASSSHSIVVTGGTLNSATFYTSSADLNITATGDVTITITAYKYVTAKTTYNILTGELEGKVLKTDNPLINNTSQVANVLTWIKNETIKRKMFKNFYKGDPRVETSDIIDIETRFSTYSDTRVIKNELEYDGGLNIKTTTLG